LQDSNEESVKTDRRMGSTWIAGAAALGALLVVAVLWATYPPSRESSSSTTVGQRLPATTGPVDLPGFRTDAWFLPDDELLGFVEIPAGPFLMGSDPAVDPLMFDNERWSNTRTQGTVDLSVFWIARYEVTVAQFSAFVEATGHSVDDRTLRGPADHPVGSVSWTDALAYSRWLDAAMRESSVTPARLTDMLRDGWRISLPTEAEWEKAARGPNGQIYPWGNEPSPDRANYERGSTTPVGSFSCPECFFGLADMSGNVWELTRSPFQAYPYDPNSRGDLEADALWVMRGGSFSDPARNVRAATRGGVDPGARRPFIGFRLVVRRL